MAHSHFSPPPLSATSLVHRFPLSLQAPIQLYSHAMKGPFPGITAVVGGMTWARCTIFYGSDVLKEVLREIPFLSSSPVFTNFAPSFMVSTFVQVVNMPLIRATITQQDPTFKHPVTGKTPSTMYCLQHLYRSGGIDALWHGTSAGLVKTVPKYVISIMVKDTIGELQAEQNGDRRLSTTEQAQQSAVKAVVAGISGAVLTNPADVIRNEMFKDDRSSFFSTLKKLTKGGEWRWAARGVDKNLIAVAGPISLTIFLTDLFERNMGGDEIKRRVTRRVVGKSDE